MARCDRLREMSRRWLAVAVTLVVAAPAGGLTAEPAPWAPLRFGGSAVIAAPLDGELVLTSFEISVLQQAGWVNVDGDGHGGGLIAGIGGTGGLGLFGPAKDGACADEVSEDGDTRWTCGQLTLGPTAMIGFASGTKLETGFVRQDRLLFLRATPHLALVKSPERGTFEVGLATALGFAFRPFQLEATWIKVGFPEHLEVDHELGTTSDDTGPVGLGLELTAGWMRGAVFVGAGTGLVLW